MNKEIVILQPERIPHHEISSQHRDMNDMEFESLKLDIENNGQLIPILLYRGKIVDGRHRQRALIELGIHDIKCISIPNNTSLEEVKNKVIGTEMRRSDNVAQKSIRAFHWMNDNTGSTQQEAAIKFGINQARVSETKKLYDFVGSKTIDKLYNQGYLIYGGKKYTVIAKILQYLNTNEQEQIDREPTTKQTKNMIDNLYEMFRAGDIAGIAIIESTAKSLRMKEI